MSDVLVHPTRRRQRDDHVIRSSLDDLELRATVGYVDERFLELFGV